MLLIFWMSTAEATPPVLQLGATVPYGVHPGVRVGIRQPLRAWEAANSQAALIVGGDIASYVDPADHVSGLLGATAGVQWIRPRGFGVAVEAGLALIADRQTLGEVVDLSSGERTADHEMRWSMLPALTGRLSWREHRPISIYTGLTVGPEIGFGRDGALVYTVDVGVRVRLNAGGAR